MHCKSVTGFPKTPGFRGGRNLFGETFLRWGGKPRSGGVVFQGGRQGGRPKSKRAQLKRGAGLAPQPGKAGKKGETLLVDTPNGP